MEQQESPKNRFESLVESRRKKMIEVMERLEAKRYEAGVVTVGKKFRDNVSKVDIFLAGVEASSPEQGSIRDAVDHVVVTPDGFFAIRHYTGTEEGKTALRGFENALYAIWNDSKTHHDPNFMNPNLEFYYSVRSSDYVRLSFAHPGREFSEEARKHGDNGRLTYNTEAQNRSKEGILLSSLGSADSDTVSRAFEASRARVERMNMSPTKQLLQEQQTIQTADSLLDKLGGA